MPDLTHRQEVSSVTKLSFVADKDSGTTLYSVSLNDKGNNITGHHGGQWF